MLCRNLVTEAKVGSSSPDKVCMSPSFVLLLSNFSFFLFFVLSFFLPQHGKFPSIKIMSKRRLTSFGNEQNHVSLSFIPDSLHMNSSTIFAESLRKHMFKTHSSQRRVKNCLSLLQETKLSNIYTLEEVLCNYCSKWL